MVDTFFSRTSNAFMSIAKNSCPDCGKHFQVPGLDLFFLDIYNMMSMSLFFSLWKCISCISIHDYWFSLFQQILFLILGCCIFPKIHFLSYLAKKLWILWLTIYTIITLNFRYWAIVALPIIFCQLAIQPCATRSLYLLEFTWMLYKKFRNISQLIWQ